MKEKNKKDERLESLFSEYVQDEKMPLRRTAETHIFRRYRNRGSALRFRKNEASVSVRNFCNTFLSPPFLRIAVFRSRVPHGIRICNLINSFLLS